MWFLFAKMDTAGQLWNLLRNASLTLNLDHTNVGLSRGKS